MENEVVTFSVAYATDRLVEAYTEGRKGNSYGSSRIQQETEEWFFDNLDGVVSEDRAAELWFCVEEAVEKRLAEEE